MTRARLPRRVASRILFESHPNLHRSQAASRCRRHLPGRTRTGWRGLVPEESTRIGAREGGTVERRRGGVWCRSCPQPTRDPGPLAASTGLSPKDTRDNEQYRASNQNDVIL